MSKHSLLLTAVLFMLALSMGERLWDLLMQPCLLSPALLTFGENIIPVQSISYPINVGCYLFQGLQFKALALEAVVPSVHPHSHVSVHVFRSVVCSPSPILYHNKAWSRLQLKRHTLPLNNKLIYQNTGTDN